MCARCVRVCGHGRAFPAHTRPCCAAWLELAAHSGRRAGGLQGASQQPDRKRGCVCAHGRARVRPPPTLARPGDGFKIAMRGLDGGRLSIASCSVGAAWACLEAAVGHVKTRKQFGKTLGEQQVRARARARPPRSPSRAHPVPSRCSSSWRTWRRACTPRASRCAARPRCWTTSRRWRASTQPWRSGSRRTCASR